VGAGPAVGAAGLGAAILKVAKSRRFDGAAAERVIFALVAQRALEPASKLAATMRVAERVFLEGCPGFSDAAAYGAMDFPLEALALLLIRVAENATDDTWRNLLHELDRMHLVTFATSDGRVAQSVADVKPQVAGSGPRRCRWPAGSRRWSRVGLRRWRAGGRRGR